MKTTSILASLSLAVLVSGCPAADTCDDLTAGTWDMGGSAFGMTMGATVAVDSAGCTFAFSDWSMGMDVPAGGVIAGDAVTFTNEAMGDDDDSAGMAGRDWAACTGTLASATSASGTCSDDGATWTMDIR